MKAGAGGRLGPVDKAVNFGSLKQCPLNRYRLNTPFIRLFSATSGDGSGIGCRLLPAWWGKANPIFPARPPIRLRSMTTTKDAGRKSRSCLGAMIGGSLSFNRAYSPECPFLPCAIDQTATFSPEMGARSSEAPEAKYPNMVIEI